MTSTGLKSTSNSLELIRRIGPALRALLTVDNSGPLKLVAFDDFGNGDETPVGSAMQFEPNPADDDDALIARLRQAIEQHTARAKTVPTVVQVQGVGQFVSAAAESSGRVAGKVMVITGAAQGFGLEIARGLATEGAYVVLADVNETGVAGAARDVCEKHGPRRALGLPMDVTDGESIRRAIDQVVRNYGGFDVFISNAGVLRAESVKSQSERDFDFVTNVNYKGYFLCVQKAVPVLAMQHRANSAYRSDIIQINSKSGLIGSKKNFAYAGSKFGGIGLTQSFALELVEDGIKVNSVCPGNYLDGPLWSDPDRGLFVQYLRAGKIPGAKTVSDVIKAYEAKVPMGRGCTSADVVKAILYLIDQQYETGQALPVTGGQEMLR